MKHKLVLLVSVVCLLTATVPSAQAWGNCAQFHRVRFGETLASIARFYGTTFPYLASINGLTNPNRIFAGQVLCIAIAQQPTTYVVQRGDWLARIAQRFGVNLFDLIRVNNIRNPNWIFPGQVLTIPTSYGGYSGNSQQSYTPPANGQMNQPPPYVPPGYGGGSMNPPPPNATPEVSY
jgi:LysM repeat protein